MNNPGIVICTRSNSRRIPNKPLQEVGNPSKALIAVLSERLQKIGLPFVMAMPRDEINDPLHIKLIWNRTFFGSNSNVLDRFFSAAKASEFDPVIRVTHDDILIDGDVLRAQLDKHIKNGWDYSYPVNVIDGTGAEIVNMSVLKEAMNHYPADQDIEHLSYVFKKFSRNTVAFDAAREGIRPKIDGGLRLTIDYPEDLKMFSILYEFFRGEIDLQKIYREPELFKTLKTINKKPDITVYTCVKNGHKTLSRAIKSVLSQKDVSIEYIICDDGSFIPTKEILWEHSDNPRVKIICNKKNMGLAYSSNKCLKEAKGDYFIRMDADDEFVNNHALKEMYDCIEPFLSFGVCYAAYYKNDPKIDHTVYKPNTDHHAGCAMIDRRVFEEIKFNEGLRHWDGLDFFIRLTKYRMFSVCYIHEPLWIYHQSPNSMSKSEPEKRVKIKDEVLKNFMQ